MRGINWPFACDVGIVRCGGSTTLESTLIDASAYSAETPPAGLDEALVRDSVTIRSAGPTGVCLAVALRSSSDTDQGLSGWQLEIGKERVYPDEKSATVEVNDYDYTGTHRLVDLSVFGVQGSGALSIGKPEARVFRVITRTFSVCGTTPLADKVDFSIKILVSPGQRWHQRFLWEP